MIKHYRHILNFILLVSCVLHGQDIKLFKTHDFDLKGKVKSCTVVTDYGKEIFDFDENGFLVKSTTQYNERDKDIVRYKYDNGELLEKRMESYKDNALDASSSLVNFYEIDTTGLRYIKETIVSFDKEFFEQQEYYYNEAGLLTKIVSSHENAVDERLVERTQFKDEQTESCFDNGVITQSIRTSTKKTKSGKTLQVVLRKQFVDGDPSKAVEQITNSQGQLVSEKIFMFDGNEDQFVPEEDKIFSYDKDGVLTKMTLKKGNAESIKEFIFQFDDSGHKNWVKKIITPDNTYTSRIISYYEPEPVAEENN